MADPSPHDTCAAFLRDIQEALGAPAHDVAITGSGDLPSVFAVSDLAAATMAAAGAGVAELIALRHGAAPAVQVDRRLASMWFAWSLRPQGWAVPPPWDPVAGDYCATDGFIRLHTNAPHHREAALKVLGCPADKGAVAAAVKDWRAEVLESAVIEAGGCAAAMHSAAEWAAHPQGQAVAAEPLLDSVATAGERPDWPLRRDRPLAGLRVLDLTRVLAGPIATRFLAGFGAEVLRIDPPWWDEPGVVPDVTAGKRCARLDLRDPQGRATLERLLAAADVLVHGYRSDALARLGLDAVRRQKIRPGLVDVSLDAYGFTGPWRGRRGFDSLVQMSCGIAEAGMRLQGRDRPTPLPVQALDHATGYLLAAAGLRGLARRLATGGGCVARTSLARVAALLMSRPAAPAMPFAPESAGDLADAIEATAWGPARRLKPPLIVEGAPFDFDLPAGPLGASPPTW
jgi:hypothetical protein